LSSNATKNSIICILSYPVYLFTVKTAIKKPQALLPAAWCRKIPDQYAGRFLPLS
jgi:hypothetical protein